jgi:hypothetical protein
MAARHASLSHESEAAYKIGPEQRTETKRDGRHSAQDRCHTAQSRRPMKEYPWIVTSCYPASMPAARLHRHMPVLLLTECLDIGCYLEAMQLGAADYGL